MRTFKSWYSIQITRHLMEDVFMERGRESGLEGATSEREEKIPGWSDWEREKKKRQSRIMKDVGENTVTTCEGCQVNSDFKGKM